MSFLEKALEAQGGLPIVEEVVEEQVEEPTKEIEPPSDLPEKEIAKEEVAVEEPKLTKKEINYREFLEQNKETIKSYLNETSTDYSKLPHEELVKRKILNDNPELDEDDALEELRDKYGIGLEKVEIDEEEMTPDEIRDAKQHNAEVDKAVSKGKRELKKDAVSASKFFEEKKNGIELPKWEVEEAEQSTPQKEVFDEESYQKQLVEQVTEQKEKYWIPQLKAVIDPFEKVTEQVKYEDNGNEVVLDVEYKLSKQEKDDILGQLSDYISQPSDSKYFDANGNPDLQRFVEDKTKELNYTKLLKTVAKEASALARKDYVKNHVINYDDSKQQPDSGEQGGTSGDFFKSHASKQKNKL